MGWFKQTLSISGHKLAESLGLETLGGVFTKIIDKGSDIPIKKSQVFSTAEDNQQYVSIKVLSSSKKNAELASDAILLAECEISKIKPAPRGVPQIEVIFEIAEQGALNVSAINKETGEQQKININEYSYAKEESSKEENSSKGEDSVGTGFFVDNKGHVVTNYHVVQNTNNKSKIMYNHEEIETNLIAYDKILDLALLKTKIKNKNFIKFSKNSPKKAQGILVAGYPYGKFISDDLKITSGIINSLKGIQNSTSMLQIDATINPGNSGGPIVDKDTGGLVGVATMKLSKDFTKAAFGQESENTNYGIKSSQVRDFLEANNVKVTFKSNNLKIEELESSTVFVFYKK